MSLAYEDFVARKLVRVPPTGLPEVPELHPSLFQFQRDLVAWALRRGRAALFASTGLGKSRMQSEWARCVAEHMGRQVLVLAPLAVASQTVREAATIGIRATYAREAAEVDDAPVVVTNYERLHKFDPAMFAGVVLDESSRIKFEHSKTLQQLMAAFREHPFRLCATATPAPNDYTELGTHAEFLGICSRTEMLAEFFVHDGGSTQDWRLKGHARGPFWRWVASWAALVQRPSDLGYDDGAYELPPLHVTVHTIAADHKTAQAAGMLFAQEASTLSERRAAKRGSIADRVARCAEIIGEEPDEHWVVWCNLNDESAALAKAMPEAVEIRGSHSSDEKEAALAWFSGDVECPCRMMTEATTGREGTRPTQTSEQKSSQTPELGRSKTKTRRANTCANTTRSIERDQRSSPSEEPRHRSETPRDESNTQATTLSRLSAASKRSGGQKTIQSVDSSKLSNSTASQCPTTGVCSTSSAVDAQSADLKTRRRRATDDSTSTTAMTAESYGGSSARSATSALASSTTTRNDSNAPRCTCGRQLGGPRILISKSSMTGFGLNWQFAARMAFVGVDDSWEAYYQAIRREWRFGQTRPVHVHIFASELEGAVVANLERKERDAKRMAEELSAETRETVRAEVRGQARTVNAYARQTINIPAWLKTEDAA